MKKIIITMLILLLMAIIAIEAVSAVSITDIYARQTKAHEIAELARELGCSEDDAIIKRASEIWWQAEQDKANIEPERTCLGVYKVTGYDPYCSHCCGKSNGITASGAKASVGRTVAMSGVPFGTKVYIEGLGTYTVQDRGVGSGQIDIACNGHSACCAVTGNYKVWRVAN